MWTSTGGQTSQGIFHKYNEKAKTVTLLVPREIPIDRLIASDQALIKRLAAESARKGTTGTPEPRGPGTPIAKDRNTVPSAIMNLIKKRAQKEWPDDYQMQEYEMKNQREGYLAVANYSAESFPKSILSKIMVNAKEEWPDDYKMQKHTIDKQVEAYRAVTSYRATHLPSDVLNQIKSNAVRDWPDDYAMQKYEIDTQVKAYRAVNP